MRYRAQNFAFKTASYGATEATGAFDIVEAHPLAGDDCCLSFQGFYWVH